jgi:hypothetical protein
MRFIDLVEIGGNFDVPVVLGRDSSGDPYSFSNRRSSSQYDCDANDGLSAHLDAIPAASDSPHCAQS